MFIDFDGTIATEDVGRRFFTTFSGGRNIPLVKRWARREISSVQCLREEAKLITADRAELSEFSKGFNIDPGFRDLHRLCIRNGVPVYVVSDGLDLYIEPIMRASGFGDVPVLANRAIFNGNQLEIEFPYIDSSCDHCGNCKGIAIRRLLKEGDSSIFVGDGYSDLCAVEVADYLFAKGDLAEYLHDSGKRFVPFDTLRDVTHRVQDIIQDTA